jgi:hypothetical protein
MQNTPTVAKLQRHSDLIPDLHDLTLGELLPDQTLSALAIHTSHPPIVRNKNITYAGPRTIPTMRSKSFPRYYSMKSDSVLVVRLYSSPSCSVAMCGAPLSIFMWLYSSSAASAFSSCTCLHATIYLDQISLIGDLVGMGWE